MASSTTDVGAALSAAIAGGYVAQLNGGTYTVTQPIVININSTSIDNIIANLNTIFKSITISIIINITSGFITLRCHPHG